VWAIPGSSINRPLPRPDIIMVHFMENETIWNKAVDSLKERVGQQNFEIWIKPISFLSMDEEKVQLEVPNRFFKEWISEHFASQIQGAIAELTRKGFIFIFGSEMKNRIKRGDPLPFRKERGPEGSCAASTVQPEIHL